MQYRIDHSADINLTSLQGQTVAPYRLLRQLFGDPGPGTDDGKSRVNWTLVFDDGTLATVYDWKSDIPLHLQTQWNIGGHDRRAAQLVIEALGDMRRAQNVLEASREAAAAQLEAERDRITARLNEISAQLRDHPTA